jgi:alpha-tubulin suppressor-like RCC1 family protein
MRALTDREGALVTSSVTFGLTDGLRARLRSIVASWRDLLSAWSQGSDGRSSAIESSSLAVLGVPARLDHDRLPEVELVINSALPGSSTAYSTDRILINTAWFARATVPDVHRQLTDALGHHLDAKTGRADTPGDEGAFFASLLIPESSMRAHQSRDVGLWWPDGEHSGGPTPVEQASLLSRSSHWRGAPGRTNVEHRNQSAFAVLKADGSIVAWGDAGAGGDLSPLADELGTHHFVQIYSSARAFAGLTQQGAVLAWGDPGRGGLIPSRLEDDLRADVITIASTDWAFAALTTSGSVFSWGDVRYGGFIPEAVAAQLRGGVTDLYATRDAFAAVKDDGSVLTWGHGFGGGDSSRVSALLRSDVERIVSSERAFAAIKDDGSVVTWGNGASGGNSSLVADQLASGVIEVAATTNAFAALLDDGSVLAWGDRLAGGAIPASVASKLTYGVASITASASAFAALKDDTSVVSWGADAGGGDSSAVADQLQGGVKTIVAADVAFAAIKADGSVVTWGDPERGGDSSVVAELLQGGVFHIAATDSAFAALKHDGSVITWGFAERGGNSAAVAAELRDVNELFSTGGAFAARRVDGSVVTWGDVQAGGDSGAVDSLLLAGVVGFADPFHDDVLLGHPVAPLLDLNADGALSLLEDGLFLAAATGTQRDPLIGNATAIQLVSASLLNDVRLDLDRNEAVGLSDANLLVRFGLGTFPGEALTHGFEIDRPAQDVWQHLQDLLLL